MVKGKMRLGILVLAVLSFLMLVSVASAAVVPTQVKVNGDEFDVNTGHDNFLEVSRGEKLTLRVTVMNTGTSEAEDVQLTADILGHSFSTHERDMVSDTTRTFDLGVNNTATKTLDLEIPVRADTGSYKLRLRVADRDGTSTEDTIQLNVVGIDEKDAVVVRDVTFSPEQVYAGRGFVATVRMRNYDNSDLEDIKVTVRVPEWNTKASTYVDELDADDSITSQEVVLRAPAGIAPGTYDVEVEVEFDEFESTTATASITVLGDGTTTATQAASATGRTVLTVGPDSQDVVAGAGGATYPVTITNEGATARTYTVTASASFADVRVNPSNVLVVEAGQTKAAYVFVTAHDDATAGEQMFTVSVASNGKTLQDVTLKANVVGNDGSTGLSSVKKGLEVGLVVLVVLLVILGLIVGFNKLKGDDEGKDETQTYY